MHRMWSTLKPKILICQLFTSIRSSIQYHTDIASNLSKRQRSMRMKILHWTSMCSRFCKTNLCTLTIRRMELLCFGHRDRLICDQVKKFCDFSPLQTIQRNDPFQPPHALVYLCVVLILVYLCSRANATRYRHTVGKMLVQRTLSARPSS